jgi:Tol biopolymer transport system component
MRRHLLGALLLMAAVLVACGGGKKQPVATPGGGTATPNEEVTLPLHPDQNTLYAVNADGTGLRKLFDEGDYLDVSLSPEGGTVAISALSYYPASTASLLLLDLATGERQEIASGGANESIRIAAWSPDGTWLAFLRYAESAAVSGLYLYDVAGGTTRRVDVSAYAAVWSPVGDAIFVQGGDAESVLHRISVPSLEARQLLRASIGYGAFDVSPDGRQVAVASFDSDETGASGTGTITLVQADGSGQRDLLTVEETQAFGFGVVAWSPDGARIAYGRMSFGDDGPRGTYALDVATGASTRLTAPTEGFDYDMTWSQDGAWLFISRVGCVQCDGGGAKVVLAAADGSGEAALPGTDRFEFASSQAAWSPDESRFAYGGDRLYVANADGTAARPIAELPASAYAVAGWADDSTVLFTRVPDGAQAIYAAQPDGSGLELLHLGQGAVAPDGKAVAELTEDALVISAPGRDDVIIAREGLTALGIVGVAGGVLTWSPDSSRVAIAIGEKGGNGVAVADLEGNLSLAVDGPLEGFVRWSPDGDRLAYWSEGALWTADASGGAPVRLVNVAAAPGLDWSPDGERVAFFDGADVRSVSSQGGASELLFSPALDPYSSKLLRWSPDGEYVALSNGRELVVGAVDSGATTRVVQAVVNGLDWADDLTLAYGAQPLQAEFAPGIYTFDAITGQLTALTYSSGRRHELLGRLADGRLVFASQFTL